MFVQSEPSDLDHDYNLWPPNERENVMGEKGESWMSRLVGRSAAAET
jgi:hypothetical protein